MEVESRHVPYLLSLYFNDPKDLAPQDVEGPAFARGDEKFSYDFSCHFLHPFFRLL